MSVKQYAKKSKKDINSILQELLGGSSSTAPKSLEGSNPLSAFTGPPSLAPIVPFAPGAGISSASASFPGLGGGLPNIDLGPILNPNKPMGAAPAQQPTDAYTLFRAGERAYNSQNEEELLAEDAADPTAALRAAAERQINALLNPQINALLAQERSARERGAVQDKDLQIIYAALGGELGKIPGQINQGFDASEKDTAAAYDTANAALQQNMGGAGNELAKALKASGADAKVIADTVGKNLTEEEAFLKSLNESDKAFQIGQSNTAQSQFANLSNQVIGSAAATGTGLRADAARNLTDLINQIQGKISDVRGQRGSMVERAFADLQQGQSDSALKTLQADEIRSRILERMSRIANMQNGTASEEDLDGLDAAYRNIQTQGSQYGVAPESTNELMDFLTQTLDNGGGSRGQLSMMREEIMDSSYPEPVKRMLLSELHRLLGF